MVLLEIVEEKRRGREVKVVILEKEESSF